MRALVLVALTLGCGGAQPASEAAPTSSEQAGCTEGAPRAGSAASQLEWMIGTWSSTGEDGAETVERWCAGEDGSLIGENRTIAGAQVVHSETLRVEARGDVLVYVASPSGQATTEFTGGARCGGELDSSGASNCAETCEALFTNPEHDFPNEITYGRCTQNELLVATIRGGERRASWTFERQP